MELCRTEVLTIKLPVKHRQGKKLWKHGVGEAAKEIQESRKPFEDAVAEKQKKLRLINNYCKAFPDNKITHLKKLPLGPYNIMAMREAQTLFGEKYIMLLATDQNEALGLCYSSKEIERYMRENLMDERKKKD